jgi:hypothetical protein
MRARSPQRTRRSVLLRLPFAAAVLACLVAGAAGGLVRAGVGMPAGAGGWLVAAVTGHAFLMICVFMGTVIGIERAVALKDPLGFCGPALSAGAGVAMLAGAASVAAWLVAAASLAFVAVNAVLVARQRAAHTVLLLVAAGVWALGSALHALEAGAGAVVPCWFAFLVLTVAAERLEMTRLARHRPEAPRALHAIVAAMLLGAALSAAPGAVGGVLYGAALAALAAWLALFDIARRTVRADGLSRYMAICLLLGYAWLFVAGAAWIATSLGLPWRDAALHGLGLGFVFSMMLGHAPVILPAVAGVKLRFGPVFYLPLLLLHASLVFRLLVPPFEPRALAAGAAANALALAVFAAVVAGSAIAWHLRRPSPHDHPSAVAAAGN